MSVFDSKGAVRHSARDTIGELFLCEQFPFDGRKLTVVVDTDEAECPGVCEYCSLHDAIILPRDNELCGTFKCQLGLDDAEITDKPKKLDRIWERYGFRDYILFIRWVNRTADILIAGGTIPQKDMEMYRVFHLSGSWQWRVFPLPTLFCYSLSYRGTG